MSCAPTGSLAAAPLPLDGVCRCGAKLHAVPASEVEWIYVDEADRSIIDNSPPGYREDPGGWWDSLGAEHPAMYSALSARYNLSSGACFTHMHYQATDLAPRGAPYDVPECHGWPMQYAPGGWRCRVEHTMFPFAEQAAA